MAHYFTREEAEALLPQITVVLLEIREQHRAMQQTEMELGKLHAQAMNNGHHLHEHIYELQGASEQHTTRLRELARALELFGCELKDPETGLIDFLSLRNGKEVYLCWQLGEERILFWHFIDSGFAGRQSL